MKRIDWFIGVVAAMAATGLGAGSAFAPSARLSAGEEEPVDPAPATDLNRRPIGFEDLQFEEPAVRDRLLKIEAEARAIAAPDWDHLPWHWRGGTGQTPETLYFFATQWCSEPRDTANCICRFTSIPCRSIYLSARPRDLRVGQPKKIHSLTLSVSDNPQRAGWGVRMHYSENWLAGKQIQEHFWIQAYRAPWPPEKRPEAAFACWSGYGINKRFGAVEYVISASLPQRPRQFRARQYLLSADLMKKTVLANLDAIEPIARQQIESGKPICVVDHDLLVEVPLRSSVPEPPPFNPTRFESPVPANYHLTSEQKRILLEHMMAELEQRRQTVREHGDDIYAAIERAFPLGKILREIDEPRAPPANP